MPDSVSDLKRIVLFMSRSFGVLSVTVSAALVLFMLFTRICSAQSSCDSTLSTNKDNVFRYEPRGNRCEGLYRVKVAASPAIEIVGLLQGYFDYELDSTEIVDLRCPFAENRTVYVRASALPLKTYYRMDAAIRPGGKVSWPMREVLLPNGIHSDMISIYGWYSEIGKIIYTPVRAVAREYGSENDLRYRIVLRASVDIHQVVYRWKSDLKDTVFSGSYVRPFKAGTPIVITLSDKTKGWVTVVVQGLIDFSKDEWIDNSFVIDLE